MHQIGDKQWDHKKEKESNIVSSSWGGREYRSSPSSTASWSSNMLQTEGANTTRRPKKPPLSSRKVPHRCTSTTSAETVGTSCRDSQSPDSRPPQNSPDCVEPASSSVHPPQDHTSAPTFKIRLKERVLLLIESSIPEPRQEITFK